MDKMQKDARKARASYDELKQEVSRLRYENQLLQDVMIQYRVLFDSTSDAIVIFDKSGKLDCNPAALRLFGFHTKEDFLTTTWSEIFPEKQENNGDSIVLNNEMVELALKNGAHSYEWVHKKSDGSIFYSEVLLTPFEFMGRKIVQSSVRDISRRKKYEEELKFAKEAAEAGDRAKSEFLANMSHEIRTPMNAILGFTTILKDRIKDPQLSDYIGAVSTSGKTLLRLINDILDLSKIEAGQLELNCRQINIRQLFSDFSQIFMQKLQEKGIELIINVAEDIPEHLVADDTRIRQIILNLLGNAIKFTDEGKVELWVHLAGEAKAKLRTISLAISVIDTGVGIPANQTDYIFKAFRQQAGQDNSKYGGTGLGLAITKRLVNMMNGSISVESVLGHGSTFNVVIPNLIVPQELSIMPTKSVNIYALKFKPATILVADDISTNRSLVKAILSAQPFSFIEADNGKTAIEMAQKHHPDLILMDMKMPKMNGYDATKILMADKATSNIPVIALTASAMKEQEIKFFKCGCTAIIKKPIIQEELFAELQNFLAYETTETAECPPEVKCPSLEDNQDCDYEQLYHVLKEEILPAWKEVHDTYIMNNIEMFANKVFELGEAYNVELLMEWADTILNNSRNFDMEKLPLTLNKFPNILVKIQNFIK